jgi:hypothetical protein
MKQSIYMKKTMTGMWLAMAVCLALGIQGIVSIALLAQFETPYAEMFFLFIFSAIVFITAWKLFEQLTEKIEVTEEELIYYSMFRKRKSLNWRDISEFGVGQRLTPAGIRHCFFFSKRKLSDREIDNLGTVDDGCIYLNNLTRKNYEVISKYCSGPEVALMEKWVSDQSI